MRFSINLATRIYLDRRLLNQVSVFLLTVLVLVLGWNVTRISWNLGEQRKLASEVKTLEGGLNIRPGGITEKDFSRQQARIRFFNEIIDRKGVGWINLLDVVESVTPEGVALAALTPGKKPGEWKLEGRARSFALVRQYLEKLEGSKSFSEILLLSHRELQFGEKGRGIQFSISCKVQF